MSKIQWTEKTWNPVTGCSHVSMGCDHCYAETMHRRLHAMKAKGYEKPFSKVVCHPDRLHIPLRRTKPTMYFVNSMSDLFHPDVSDFFIADVFDIMASATTDCGKRHKHVEECWCGDPHTFQILTKRPARMLEFLSKGVHHIIDEYWSGDTVLGAAMECCDWPLPNVWLGTSVESSSFTKRIDILRTIPAAVRFISCEPLLAPMGELNLDDIHWVIIGGESGPGARPMELAWARDIVRQCKEQGVACFVKQLGGHPSKQGEIEHFPEDLQIREYPK